MFHHRVISIWRGGLGQTFLRHSVEIHFLIFCLVPMIALAETPLIYQASEPPLEVTFAVQGGRYSGEVHPGCLLLQTDISDAPVVRWPDAEIGKFYTLLMLDFDGNATGSWPDAVPSGKNSPVRHWVVGNLPGELLRTTGYAESTRSEGSSMTVLQSYRCPHIPMVSDRYAVYLFPQIGPMKFAELTDQVTNFDHAAFCENYQLAAPIAANYFVAVYTSESPFSGKPFHGNDVSRTWHQDLGKGQLTP